MNKLKEVAGLIAMPQAQPESESLGEESADVTETPAKKRSLLWSSFDDQVKRKQDVSAHRMTATELEVRRHLETPSLPRDADPLEYWKNYSALSPRLSLIAKDILCIPAISVPSERLFSKAGELISNRKASLKAKNVDMILFLNNIRC